MGCLNVVGMVVSVGRPHAFGNYVVWNDFPAIREGLTANATLHPLLNNLARQQSSHFRRRPAFALPSGVVRVLDALHRNP